MSLAPRRELLNPWPVLVVGVAALVVLPVAVMAAEALTPSTGVLRRLWENRLPEMLISTVALLALVSIGTTLLGVSMAWLVSAYRFPGRSVFRIALVLPLAMPGYILGYIFMTTFSFAGPVQSTLRDWFGTSNVWFPNVRSVPGAAVVLSLTLYPYVYVLMLTALREQGLRTWQVSRTLGQGRIRGAWRAVLPAARPTLAAGVALVMMEVLTDFATVQYFNVETLPVGIYKVWTGEGNRVAATQLAVLVLGFALAIIVLERTMRGRARFYQAGAKGFLEPVMLRGSRRWFATGACLAVLSAAFLLPVYRLLTWTDLGTQLTFQTYVEHMGRSITLAAMAAGGCLLVGGLVTAAGRLTGGRVSRWAAKGILVGYALPGTVIALGVLSLFSGLGRVTLVTTSLLGVVYAYVVRFVPLSTVTVDASLEKVTPSVVMAARTLGARPGRILRRIHLPMLRSGAAAALLLVFVHTLQELSIVLLLRPFGYDTLAVLVFGLTQNSAWEETGLPALTIIAVALVPVILMLRAGAGGNGPSQWERALAEPTAIPGGIPGPPGGAVKGGRRMSGSLKLDGLAKRFGDVAAVDGVSLDLATGEHLALIGPSGCGKSTILLMVAGLLAPDDGEIVIGNRRVAGAGTWVEPEKRRVGMVFQDYALFPHLTVTGNIGFGLDRLTKLERAKRVQEVLALVDLEALSGRYPHELSSGQQQRVALARSLAPDPAVVLLDEPFSNLDRTLRESLRVETKAVLRRASATAVLVTHDHSEALGFGDRIAVMRSGHILQVGPPEELFDFPEDEFVATFLGSADFLPARRVDSGMIASEVGTFGPLEVPAEGDLAVMVRPHEVTFNADAAGPATIVSREYQGATVLYELTLDSGSQLSCRRAPAPHFEVGTRVQVRLIEGYPPVLFSEGRRIWPAGGTGGHQESDDKGEENTNGTHVPELERRGPGNGVGGRRVR